MCSIRQEYSRCLAPLDTYLPLSHLRSPLLAQVGSGSAAPPLLRRLAPAGRRQPRMATSPPASPAQRCGAVTGPRHKRSATAATPPCTQGGWHGTGSPLVSALPRKPQKNGTAQRDVISEAWLLSGFTPLELLCLPNKKTGAARSTHLVRRARPLPCHGTLGCRGWGACQRLHWEQASQAELSAHVHCGVAGPHCCLRPAALPLSYSTCSDAPLAIAIGSCTPCCKPWSFETWPKSDQGICLRAHSSTGLPARKLVHLTFMLCVNSLQLPFRLLVAL